MAQEQNLSFTGWGKAYLSIRGNLTVHGLKHEYLQETKSGLKKTLPGLWKNEKSSSENIRLRVTESLSNVTRNKLSSTFYSKELTRHSHLPRKITWLGVGLDVQEF